jgi:hypothetical protein
LITLALLCFSHFNVQFLFHILLEKIAYFLIWLMTDFFLFMVCRLLYWDSPGFTTQVSSLRQFFAKKSDSHIPEFSFGESQSWMLTSCKIFYASVMLHQIWFLSSSFTFVFPFPLLSFSSFSFLLHLPLSFFSFCFLFPFCFICLCISFPFSFFFPFLLSASSTFVFPFLLLSFYCLYFLL